MFIHEVLAVIIVSCFLKIILTIVAKCSLTDSISTYACRYLSLISQ